jgi:hypothetical protein
MSKTPQNSFQNFLQQSTGLLLDICASNWLYGCLEIRANSTAQNFWVFNGCTASLKTMPNFPENTTANLLDFCAIKRLYGL